MRKILSFYGVLPKLQRIAKLAREKPGVALTTLAHHIDYQFLYAVYLLTRKDGAVGADGQTAEEYKIGLRERLESLLDRFKSGTYRAPAVRRVQIPKGDGKRTHSADRYSDVRGQDPPEGGSDGAGGSVRIGVFGLFVWFPARALGASGAGSAVAGADGDGACHGYRT
jgi:hypothetical protein